MRNSLSYYVKTRRNLLIRG